MKSKKMNPASDFMPADTKPPVDCPQASTPYMVAGMSIKEELEFLRGCQSRTPFYFPDIESNTSYADAVADGCIQECADAIRARSDAK
jgi:hypothetical protein